MRPGFGHTPEGVLDHQVDRGGRKPFLVLCDPQQHRDGMDDLTYAAVACDAAIRGQGPGGPRDLAPRSTDPGGAGELPRTVSVPDRTLHGVAVASVATCPTRASKYSLALTYSSSAPRTRYPQASVFTLVFQLAEFAIVIFRVQRVFDELVALVEHENAYAFSCGCALIAPFVTQHEVVSIRRDRRGLSELMFDAERGNADCSASGDVFTRLFQGLCLYAL